MFKDSRFSEELTVALEAAEKAGEIIDEYAAGKAKVEGQKSSGNDIFTEADLKCQEVIVETVTEAFPEDSFLAEEDLDYNEENKDGRKWIVDPIDGTSNFQRGLEYFCTSIAFEVDGDKKLGVVYSPEKGISKLFFALKNKGAYRADSPSDFDSMEGIEVSEVSEFDESLVFSRISNFEGEHENQKHLWSSLAEKDFDLRYMSAGALELCRVAEGVGEAFMSHTESMWDLAAGELIVREAGGKVEVEVSSVSGKQKILASNGKVHGLIAELSEKFYE